MNSGPDLDRIVTDWLRSVAPTRAPQVLLLSVLEQVGETGQEHSIGGPLWNAWTRSSPRLHWAIVLMVFAAALLGAFASAGALLRQTTPRLNLALPADLGAKNGWIAYSTDGQNPGSTDDTSGSDIYLVRQGTEPSLIAAREGGPTRNVCPAFSPDGTKLAYGAAAPEGRTFVVLGVDANGVTGPPVRITVPGLGRGVCVRWSSDGTDVAYLDGGAVIVRGLDGSTRAVDDGDPGVWAFAPTPAPSDPLLSPSGEWSVRSSEQGGSCDIVVAKPDGTSARVIPLSFCPYAIATWSPDESQVLLMEDVSGHDFTMHAIAVNGSFQVTIVSSVRTNGARSWPGLGDVSWQPMFP